MAVALTLVTLLYALSGATPARAQAGRVYITPDPAASGGISGRVPMALTHAIAVKRDRVSVYLAALSDGGQAFRFEHLPIGKYDLVLVSKTGTVFEGLALGDNGSQLSATQRSNLEKRIDLADSFFKQHTLHRFGVTGLDSGGDAIALAFVERYRGNDVLKQNGEKLNERVRRLEIIELHQATDDWQFISTRHLYREGEPNSANPQFFKHATIPALGNIRVVENAKDLGTLNLTSDTVQNP